MFGYSAESMVQYDEKDIREVHQNHQRPDGMYWLYRASRIEKLLNAESTTRGKKVGDIVQSRPTGSTTANMAFPFLLFEAKSANSADNFSMTFTYNPALLSERC
ncbi:uncharacterized protein A1O5_00488 [Cladophialophora psammophila CBS 110553]|uniref:Uncharacterized protein n=1 Tax=Cladophialophora psammophila CBS 110553 TaxID=1182543 RepID=W9XF63_9EURO|nr:uncharacterized protein A1O5_00488 [Cladophialophora psammophila CBS 110553]EXJ75980.1 hypothetical protein A1O5_00488 [Cladophialophora psammophila CBS 110553]